MPACDTKVSTAHIPRVRRRLEAGSSNRRFIEQTPGRTGSPRPRSQCAGSRRGWSLHVVDAIPTATLGGRTYHEGGVNAHSAVEQRNRARAACGGQLFSAVTELQRQWPCDVLLPLFVFVIGQPPLQSPARPRVADRPPKGPDEAAGGPDSTLPAHELAVRDVTMRAALPQPCSRAWTSPPRTAPRTRASAAPAPCRVDTSST